MNYESTYYNIESFPKEERDAYAWILERLENMSRKELLVVAQHPDIQLDFIVKNWQKTTPLEEIISALISDFQPSELIKVIKSLK